MDCSVCGFNLKCGQEFEEHNRVHRYFKNASFSCFYCQRKIFGFNNLIVHIQQHKVIIFLIHEKFKILTEIFFSARIIDAENTLKKQRILKIRSLYPQVRICDSSF